MLPELGKYAGTVLWAYGASLALLAILVAMTLYKGRKVRDAMEEVEKRNG
jgi:heme exporter protein D